MTEAVIAALITGTLSLAGIVVSSALAHRGTMAELAKAQAVTDEKIETLTREVRAHNEVIKRTYALESRAELQEEKLRAACCRIDGLEREAAR